MLNKEEEKEIKEDLGVLIDIDTLSNTAGGKTLIKALNKQILSALEIMLEQRKTFTLQEYISNACDIKSKLDVVKILTNAKKEIQGLENILKEQIE